MKKLCFLVTVFSFFGNLNAQIITFPDANFKAKLLQANSSNQIARNASGNYVAIDTNGNSQIEVAEAQLIYLLNVSNTNSVVGVKISNLTGLLFFPNLDQFYCYDNLITSLDLSSFTNLTSIGCDSNQITNLNVSGLTNLTNLSCESNQIVSLDLTNKPNLTNLNCLANNLSTLNLSGLTSLVHCRASYNPYSILDFTGLSNIESIQCMSTNITTLDVSHLYQLNLFMCGFCPNLQSIFMKNGIVETGLNFQNIPNIRYICADDAQLNTIQAHINAEGYINCVTNSYCSFTPGGVFYTIEGNAKYDNNSNGCDSGDSVFPNLKINISNIVASAYTISNNSGNYYLPVSSGTHTFTPVLENPSYFTITPASAVVTFPGTNPFIQNFCVVPNGVHNDLEISIIPVTLARPGFDAEYKMVFKNKGTHQQSGTVTLNFDDAVLDFVSANPVIASQSTNVLTWNFTNLQPLETRVIQAVLNLNSQMETPPLNIGNFLDYTAVVAGLTDEAPINNTSALKQLVVGSLDPNDKTCVEGAIVSPAVIGQFVHYVIRFENTGTANAENVVVRDVIDTAKFDIITLQPIHGSHSFRTRIINTNQVEFIFENINLPFDDANNDGYIAFKVKTKSNLLVGNTFSNAASIYFDYNFPIVTNTATTTIQALGNVDFEFENYITLAPNPTKDVLNIHTNNTIEIYSASIYNTLGQLVLVITVPTSSIDVSSLKTGNYFIKIVSDIGSSSSTFIKK